MASGTQCFVTDTWHRDSRSFNVPYITLKVWIWMYTYNISIHYYGYFLSWSTNSRNKTHQFTGTRSKNMGQINIELKIRVHTTNWQLYGQIYTMNIYTYTPSIRSIYVYSCRTTDQHEKFFSKNIYTIVWYRLFIKGWKWHDHKETMKLDWCKGLIAPSQSRKDVGYDHQLTEYGIHPLYWNKNYKHTSYF